MYKVDIPSPAVAIVGRHNSGKTTLIEKLIASLVKRGHDVGSIKHHSHKDFEIDYPGKDSFRHQAAGASETVIASPSKLARVKKLGQEVECAEIVRSMPGHDIIIVEGYRKSGIPTIELMRSGNEADMAVARAFLACAKEGRSLGEDFVQISKQKPGGDSDAIHNANPDLKDKMPTSATVGVITDIDEAIEAANIYGIPAFDINDISSLAVFLEKHYVRPHVGVVIQAGGESKRMGRSKATVPFDGRPLICNIIERISPAADEILITTNERENLEFLYGMYPDLDIKLVSDKYDFRGALPGLFTALSSASSPFVAIVACDMVFASASLIVAEAIEMAKTDADVVCPVNKHGFEPFHALYRRKSCLDAVKRAIDNGESKVQSFFADSEIAMVEFSQNQVLEVEPSGGCFINANTPEELKRIEDSYLANR